uniref:AP complex subunit sigma n=1 Tax=Vannella robusta TaxID=1487602 RepID=A0A7S4MS59_9EUKA|mmetsp:Transcript_7992/g.9918  ORF Transcript_7992/g.9918 Transcript_7992/m.9918 type:complete len:157 (+) Transcript_7992:25-495(+)
MIHFVLLLNRQGKVRLTKWYSAYSQKERKKTIREVTSRVLGRPDRLCNFIDWRDYTLVYKRYASLYFIFCVDKHTNELIMLETIHKYVLALDRYYENVCELDIIYGFDQAFYILDEFIMAGEVQETSTRLILKHVYDQNALEKSQEKKTGLSAIIS